MALNAQHDLLEELILQTGQIVYDIDTDNGDIEWAGAIHTITGHPPDILKTWKSEQWRSRIHPQDRAAVAACIEKARQNHGRFQIEYRFCKADGRYIWVEECGIFSIDGHHRRMGAIKDINTRKSYEAQLLNYRDKLEATVTRRTAELLTINQRLGVEMEERVRSDAALQASEELYRRLFENTGTATVLLNADMTIAMANRKASELFDYPDSAGLVGVAIADFATAEHRERFILYHDLQAKGEPDAPNQFECRISDRGRRVRDVVVQLQWIAQTGRSIASFLDTTDIIKAEQDRERLAAVIEQSADSILITDMKGRVEYANRAFEMLHGVDRRSVIGEDIRAPFFSRQEKAILKKMTYMVSGQDRWSGRIRNTSRNGNTYIADTIIFPVCDRKGAVVNLVCTKKDITREVQLENQLQHSQKMEAIGTLAGGIAHDFNNILGGILGFAELSLRLLPKADRRIQRNLRRIVEGCERAKDLIRHILTFSRKNDEKNRPIEIQLIVKEALKLLRASIPSTIEFKHRIAPSHSVVNTTPTHIHQVIMNLCTNAAQAMEEDGGEMEIVLEEVELEGDHCRHHLDIPPGPYVHLQVRDSGKGMTTQTLSRIFEPYFTTKAPAGGTGLGLAVVHGIVRNMGGAIRATSAVGRGSTFDVYLPRLVDHEIPRDEELLDPPRGEERILVVDDEIFILEILRELLATLGYRVETAESSRQALDKLGKKTAAYDLVITDQAMPKMTGIQLAEVIRQKFPGLPVVLCTGLAVDEDEGGPPPGRFEAVLFKPIQYDQLAFTIRHVLDSREKQGWDPTD